MFITHSVVLLSCRPESDEAAAKELFEGALEALTRTKDSISRATRQAMECAKFGITNEVSLLLVFLVTSSFSSFHALIIVAEPRCLCPVYVLEHTIIVDIITKLCILFVNLSCK